LKKDFHSELRTRVLRGGIILDLIEELKLEQFAQTNIVSIMRTDFEKVPKNELENSIQFIQATYIAYDKIIRFMENLFNINDFSTETFRKKTFKGYKVVQTIDFLKFSMQECEVNIAFYEKTSNYDPSNFINFFDIQADIYAQISYKLNKGFVESFEQKYPFLEDWVNALYREINENN